MNCPLCGENQVTLVERLSSRLVRSIYERRFSINIAEFPDFALFSCDRCDLKFYSPAYTGDAAFYEQLQKYDWYYLNEKPEYEFAARYIQPGHRVLEIGAGSGAFGSRLRNNSYVGLELSQVAVEQARGKGINVQHELLETHALSHPAAYDVVCSFQVLEHVPNVCEFLRSALACLSPGGLMIHSVPSEEGFMGREVNNVLNMPPHHITRWSQKALRSVASLHGLEVVEIFHENVQEMHKRSFRAQRIYGRVNAVLGRSPRILDPLYERLPIRGAVAMMTRFPTNGFRQENGLPAGHSVVAVYRKPE